MVTWQGIAGLRVRLRNLNMMAFPDMPRVSEIISCGFSTQQDIQNDQNGAIEMAQSPQMDGTPRTEVGLACVTDAQGYVEMTIRYMESLGILHTLNNQYNLTTPATPECVHAPAPFNATHLPPTHVVW